MRRTTMLVVCSLALALCASFASAAVTTPPADTLKVNYFSNANTAGAPDGTVRITNAGTSGADLCAAIYVYDQNQELSECCSCFVSPNGLRTLSINTDLTKNPLTGVTLETGTIHVVSTKLVNGSCPTYPTTVTPTSGLRSWTTHVQNGSFGVTETTDADATFSTSEESTLDNGCYAIQLVGSGTGKCSCGTGD